MSTEPLQPSSRRWFAFAALIAIGLAVGVAWLLLQIPSEKPNRVQADPIEQENQSQKPRIVTLTQTNPDGSVIEWAEEAQGPIVLLIIAVEDAAEGEGALFTIYSGHGENQLEALLESGRAVVETESLLSGPYRWSATFVLNGEPTTKPVERHREDANEPDFVIPKSVISLEQMTPMGVLLPAGGTTEAAVRVRIVTGDTESVVDVDVEQAGAPFDGVPLHSGPVDNAGTLETVLSLAPGPYHWRARARAVGSNEGEWISFGQESEEADFIVTRTDRPDDQDNQDDQSDEGQGRHSSGSSGLGGGKSTPKSSIRDPLVSLWDLLTSFGLQIGSMMILSVVVILVIVRLRAGRKS